MLPKKRRKLDTSGSSSPQLSAVAAARARRQQQSQPSSPCVSGPTSKEPSKAGSRSASFNAKESTPSSQGYPAHNGRIPQHAASPSPDPSFKASVYQSAAEYESEPESEDESEDSQLLKSVDLHSNYPLSTWQPTSSNVLKDKKGRLRIHMEPGESLAIIGHYDLWVVSGVVMLYGAVLRASKNSYRVFAPSTHALPIIECVRQANMSTAVELSSCDSGIQSLAQLSPLFGRIWNASWPTDVESALSTNQEPKSFSSIHMVSDDGFKRQLFPLEVPWKWHQTITAVTPAPGVKPPRVMVCGPKGTGKSTLVRLMVNRLLTANPSPNGLIDRVFLLDLDPGQPEYSPPGHLSLVVLQQPNLGPPFSHPITDVTRSVRTARAHALGSTSPKEDPDHFLRCAIDLMTEFDHSLPWSPLVINTPGWVVGTGGDILVQLIKKLDVTEICYTKDDEKPQIIQALTQAAGTKPVRLLPSQQSCAVAPRSAAELRDMQTLSYFHQGSIRAGHLHWDTSPLTHMKPYVVGYGEHNSAILGVACYGDWPGADYLSTLLDGSLVSIVKTYDGEVATNWPDDASPPPPLQLTIARAQNSDIPYVCPSAAGFVPPLDPMISYTIGQALIRGIDTVNKKFHILTPIPAATLANLDPAKTVLVKGTDTAPGWAYMEEVAWRNSREGVLGAGGEVEGGAGAQPWLQEIGPGGRGAGAAPLRTRRFRGVERG